jgi:hypothetical protein
MIPDGMDFRSLEKSVWLVPYLNGYAGDGLSLSPEPGQRILLLASALSKALEFVSLCLEPFRRRLKLLPKGHECRRKKRGVWRSSNWVA